MTKEQIQEQVEFALDEIRPFLISDGGNIKLVGIEGAIVKVKLIGTCVGCSVNHMTLKNGVEASIKKYVPQIEQVIQIN